MTVRDPRLDPAPGDIVPHFEGAIEVTRVEESSIDGWTVFGTRTGKVLYWGSKAWWALHGVVAPWPLHRQDDRWTELTLLWRGYVKVETVKKHPSGNTSSLGFGVTTMGEAAQRLHLTTPTTETSP